jgi:hypothetical protein
LTFIILYSSLSSKGCAIGLTRAAIGVPRKERTLKKAKELWPWLSQVSRKSFFGLTQIDHAREISDSYFNVRFGRMTMAVLVSRVRRVELAKRHKDAAGGGAVAGEARR